MIIGTIIEVTNDAGGPGSANHNGATAVVFYTYNDAETWCIEMSKQVISGPLNRSTYTTTVLVNTDTAERRWWFNGTEYTG